MTKLEEVARAIDPERWAAIDSGLPGSQQCAILRAAEMLRAGAAVEALSQRANWPMDAIAERLEAAGIDHPRPSEVLRAFFDAILTEPGGALHG